MFEYFAQLRKLPEPARRKRALLIASIVTFLIAAIWAGLLYARINNGMFTKAEDEVVAEKETPGIVETFSNFFSGIGDVFKASETYENSASPYEIK
jgi:hypothetical protein